MKRALLITLLCLGCQPELPTRACSTQGDCFTQEVCVQKQCVTARDEAPVGDADLPDVAEPETSDAGADAVP